MLSKRGEPIFPFNTRLPYPINPRVNLRLRRSARSSDCLSYVASFGSLADIARKNGQGICTPADLARPASSFTF